MLADRDYMRPEDRRFSPRFRWSVTTWLLVANAAIFLVQEITQHYGRFPWGRYFALSITGLQQGYWWQPITFQFLHGGLFHLLANLFTIYFFGRALERELGAARYLRLYFLSGTFGGLLQLGAMYFWPAHFGPGAFGHVVGASAGAFGLVAAFAALYPERTLTLLLFFVLPLSIRAKYLLYLAIGLALFGIVVPKDQIAHTAHLGGIAVGLLMTTRWRFPAHRLARLLKKKEAEVPQPLAVRQRPPPRPKPARASDPDALSREVDRILEKISQRGIHSLTPEEREILEEASARMDRG